MGDEIIAHKACQFCGHLKGSKAPMVEMEDWITDKGEHLHKKTYCKCSCHRGGNED